jgi:hypothetical protein
LVLRRKFEHPQAKVRNLGSQVLHMQFQMHLRPSTGRR